MPGCMLSMWQGLFFGLSANGFLERIQTTSLWRITLLDITAGGQMPKGKEGVKKVDWPPNSRDLNPIERIWMLLKSTIQRRRGSERVTTIRRMREVLMEEWGKVTRGN